MTESTNSCFRRPGDIKFSRLLDGDRENAAVAGLHQEARQVERDRWRADCAAVRRYPRGERAVLAREKMHMALVVADHDEAPEYQRPAYAAAAHLVLLPDAGAARLVEGDNGILLIGQEKIPRIQGQPRGAGCVARP